MKLDTFPRFLVLLLLLLAASAIFSGCYGPKKAGKQVARALREQPDTAAALIRDAFPCVDGKADSSGFISSIDSLQNLLQSSKTQAKAYLGRYEQIRDSLRHAQAASGDDCSTLLAQATDYIAMSNIERDSLKMITDDQAARISAAQKQLRNIKPVIQPVEDNAKIHIAYRDRDAARMDATVWKTMYDTDHAWREKQEKKMAGSLVIYIPWWLVVVAAISTGLLLITWIKKKTLNPFSLFK